MQAARHELATDLHEGELGEKVNLACGVILPVTSSSLQ